MKNLFLLGIYLSSFVSAAIADITEIRPEKFSTQTNENDISSFQPHTPISYLPPEPIYQSPRINASLAAGLSFLFPGLGHMYINDMKTAASFIGGTALAIGAIKLGEERDESISLSGAYAFQNTWAYGIYAAYRDARILNGPSGYSYKMPTESLADLASAPFLPRILKKPEVWGGVLGALTGAVALTLLRDKIQKHTTYSVPPSFSRSGRIVQPLLALPVGIGEEALFRGYLQPQLSEMLNPTAGICLSSLAFGAYHLPNTQGMSAQDTRAYCTYSIPFITAFGAYFGWLAHKNGSLMEAVAVHTLYDFTLFSLAALTMEASASENQGFTLSIPF